MSDQDSLTVAALPDGGAELHVVLHLRWEDVAALGREAGRLAAQFQRPVSLDEAASHQLRSWPAAATASKDRAKPAAAPSRTALLSGPAAEPAVQPAAAAAAPAPAATAVRSSGDPAGEPRGPFEPASRIPSLAGAAAESTKARVAG